MGSLVYTQIVEYIRRRIENGELQPGDVIDSENVLVSKFGASRMTVRRGLSVLIREGYIFSARGKGNFVKKRDFSRYGMLFSEFKNPINQVDKIKLMDVNTVPADEITALKLSLTNKSGICRTSNVVLIRRLFFTDGTPVAYDEKYILPEIKAFVAERELESASFPEIVAMSVPLFALKQELTVYAQAAADNIKMNLGLSDNAAMLVIEQKLLNPENMPLGLGITYYHGDYIRLQAESF